MQAAGQAEVLAVVLAEGHLRAAGERLRAATADLPRAEGVLADPQLEARLEDQVVDIREWAAMARNRLFLPDRVLTVLGRLSRSLRRNLSQGGW